MLALPLLPLLLALPAHLRLGVKGSGGCDLVTCVCDGVDLSSLKDTTVQAQVPAAPRDEWGVGAASVELSVSVQAFDGGMYLYNISLCVALPGPAGGCNFDGQVSPGARPHCHAI
jgi:hypothetical protein